MMTANGKAVPVPVFAEGTYSYDVTGGTMKITSDGKFSFVTNFRQTLPGSVENFVDSASGTWTASGATLQMTLNDGSVIQATSDKTTLTGAFAYEGFTLTAVYGNKK
jgi:hypothetical protein